MMIWRGDGLRPKSNFTITIKIFYIIVKIIVADILRPNSNYFTNTPTIYSFIFSYNQQYTILAWVMVLRVSGLGHISISPITANSFSRITRGKVSSIFRHISKSIIINSYIPHIVTITTTYISPPIIIIIITNTTLLFFINLFLYTKRRNL